MSLFAPRTLALDLASRITGWAADVPGTQRPAHGRFALSGIKDLGLLYCELENCLDILIEKYQPDRMIWCKAFFDKQQTAARALNGLQAIAERTAYLHGIEAREVVENNVRNCVLGRSNFGTKDEWGRLVGDGSERAKEAVLEWCASKGLKPGDHNDGDALVLLKYDRMHRAGELTDDGKHVRGQPTRKSRGRVVPNPGAGGFA